MSPQSLVPAVAGAATVVVLVLLRRWAPPPSDAAIRPMSVLQNEYGPVARRLNVVWIVAVFGAAVSWWSVLVAAAGDTGFTFDESRYGLRFEPVAWWLPAGALALTTGDVLAELLAHSVLGERYGEFCSFQVRRAGFDYKRVEKPLYTFLGLAASAAIILMGGCFTEFSAAGVRTSPFLSLRERVHPYDELTAIRTPSSFVAPNGSRVQRTTLVLEFSGASSWTSQWSPSELSDARIVELARAVSSWSGVPITTEPVDGRRLPRE